MKPSKSIRTGQTSIDQHESFDWLILKTNGKLIGTSTLIPQFFQDLPAAEA